MGLWDGFCDVKACHRAKEVGGCGSSSQWGQ